jgi:hypothetical protein
MIISLPTEHNLLHLLIPINNQTCTTIKHVGITKILLSLSIF